MAFEYEGIDLSEYMLPEGSRGLVDWLCVADECTDPSANGAYGGKTVSSLSTLYESSCADAAVLLPLDEGGAPGNGSGRFSARLTLSRPSACPSL